ncbi:hypothetical protein [Pandoraea apista]|uniref:hypothetical protein n=1 Tax=Pandoraea apista TaxID=93218 RepID=UPI00248F1158|nr:hypothetical protein [Pandoraea apista]
MTKDVVEHDFLEAELQHWLTEKARAVDVIRHIQSCHFLDARAATLTRDDVESRYSSAAAYRRAHKVLLMLAEAKFISADKSISPDDVNQMRPDLVLLSACGRDIIVELKAKHKAERETVQELLAYGAAIGSQKQHAPEPAYVIVARDWTHQLRFSVRALLMDGKHVLPLRCTRDKEHGFALHLVSDPFEFDSNAFYPPLYALLPEVLAIQRPNRKKGPPDRTTKYFASLAKEVVSECERLRQSGFVLVWSSWAGGTTETVSLALATVNQNWPYSEHTPGEYRFLGELRSALDRNIAAKAKQIRRDAMRVTSPSSIPDENLLAEAFANEKTLDLYVDSTVSFDVLNDFRKHKTEGEIEASMGGHWCFELTSMLNFANFMQHVARADREGECKLIQLVPFGDVKDFFLTHDLAGTPLTARVINDFFEFMCLFSEYMHKKLEPKHMNALEDYRS